MHSLDYLNRLAVSARQQSQHWDALAYATSGAGAIYAAKQADYHRRQYRAYVAKINRILATSVDLSEEALAASDRASQIEAMWIAREGGQ